MASSEPKRHHYIPKMLLKRFANDEGLIWVNDGSKTYKTTRGNVFSIGHLYTRSEFSNAPEGTSYSEFLNSVQKSYEYEARLSQIESIAEPAVQRIVERARQAKCPKLSPKLREGWKRFFIAMARRTPESQDRVSESKGGTDVFYGAAKNVADLTNYPLPTPEELYQDSRVLGLKKMLMSNTNAKFAAGDDPRIEAETQRFSREVGLCVAVFRIPNRSLVIGSHGLTMLDNEVGTRLGAISWLPIAHDIAVGATAFPDREFLTVLDSGNGGEQIISAFNGATSASSKVIAGPSESLVRSLTQG